MKKSLTKNSISPASKSKKSLTPYTNTKSAISLSPTKNFSTTSFKVHQKIQQSLIKFRKNRQRLCHTLDTYTLLIRSKNPIRCIEHNSNISIYCETEQKLLCANCIFGRPEHKFHRVTPIDRSYERIEKDIQTMNRVIQRQTTAMNKASQKLLQNLVEEENDAHDCLKQLVSKYEECHRRLQDSFINSKTKIIEKLQATRKNYESLMLELKFHVQSYSVGNFIRPLNNQHIKHEDILLYEHVVSHAIISQKKFEQNAWITLKKEVMTAAAQQKKKIMEILLILSKPEYKSQLNQ